MASVETQLDLDGNEIDWEQANVKNQKKNNKQLIERQRRETNDNLVLYRMRDFGVALSVDEVAARLEKSDKMLPGAVANSMRRLRKDYLIICPDPENEDPLCVTHKVLGAFRWIPVT